jgi:PAS domain S-box-containing protein
MADVLRVMYVDDEPALLEIGKLFLETDGAFVVDTLTSAKEALARLNTSQYDAIISDYQMPEMDGIGFLKVLRMNDNITPFILFTGRGREEVVILAINNGADFYLQKGGEPGAQFAELSHKIKLAVSRKRAMVMLNTARMAYWEYDAAADLFTLNDQFYSLHRTTLARTGGYTMSAERFAKRFVHSDDAALLGAQITLALQTDDAGYSSVFEVRIVRDDGIIGWMTIRLHPEKGTRGRTHRITGSSQDITERKLAEEAIRESEIRYRNIFESFEDLYFQTDMNGIITVLSPSLHRLTGWMPEELTGKPVTTLFAPPGGMAGFLKGFNTLRSVRDFELQLLKQDGSYVPVSMAAARIFQADGTPAGIAGSLRDITDRKRAQDAIIFARQKLNLMNDIARNETLNAITGIIGCVDMSLATAYPEEKRHLLKEIRDLTCSIKNQIDYTKDYQEDGINLPLWQDLSGIIDRVVKNFEKSSVLFTTPPEKTEIYAAPLLENVFFTLVNNAVQSGGNIITIRFSAGVGNDEAVILFEDDGSGIPAGDKESIFEHGFSETTGFSLFLTRHILRLTGISIRETSEPGKGARFEMKVPKGAWRMTGTGA